MDTVHEAQLGEISIDLTIPSIQEARKPPAALCFVF